jgi:hypothetical protein
VRCTPRRGSFDKAVEAADAARRRLEQSGNREPLLWAALHYNRTNAQYHQLTTVGAGQASDVFAGFQLAKSFAREAGEQGSRSSGSHRGRLRHRLAAVRTTSPAGPSGSRSATDDGRSGRRQHARGKQEHPPAVVEKSDRPGAVRRTCPLSTSSEPRRSHRQRRATRRKSSVRPPPPQAARAATADSEARRPVPAAIVSVPAASARNERPRNDDDEERAAATEFKSAPVTLVSASPATKVDGTEHAENQPRSKHSGATQPVSGGTEAETTVPLVIASPSPPPSSYQSRDASPLSNYSSNHTTPRSHAGANQTPGSSFTRHLSDRQKAASFDRHRSSPRAGPADTAATDEPAFLSMSNDGSVKYEDDFDFDA